MVRPFCVCLPASEVSTGTIRFEFVLARQYDTELMHDGVQAGIARL